MKQKMFFVMLISTILSLPLLTCALFGPTKLVVKPEAVARVDERLTQMTRDRTYSGSVLIAQDGKILLSKGYGMADRACELEMVGYSHIHRLGACSEHSIGQVELGSVAVRRNEP